MAKQSVRPNEPVEDIEEGRSIHSSLFPVAQNPILASPKEVPGSEVAVY
jgi:hypothetical protein